MPEPLRLAKFIDCILILRSIASPQTTHTEMATDPRTWATRINKKSDRPPFDFGVILPCANDGPIDHFSNIQCD